MYIRFWLSFFVLFLRFLHVLSITVPDTDVHDAQLNTATAATTSSSTPTATPSILPSPYATRFTHRPPKPLEFGVHAKRWLLAARRKIEFFVLWIMGNVLPEIRPTREDFLYLRSLEDPVFMSVTKLPTTVPPEPTSEVLGIMKASNIREILSSLEAELETRSISERKRIAEGLDQIFERSRNTEQSLESTD